MEEWLTSQVRAYVLEFGGNGGGTINNVSGVRYRVT